MGVYAYDKNVIPYLDNSSGISINNTLKFDSGIYVTQIIKNGPASKTELKEGDIIVAIDDKELETMNDLREYIYSKNPNDIVTLYKTEMEKVFGDGACDVLKIRKYGGIQVM